MREELRRNLLGLVLLAAGVGMVMGGARAQIAKLSDAGFGFIYMAGLALQVNTSPKEQAKPTSAP